MVWGGKGRSGIGDVNIQGTWEDWDGLSPNGRQYKNAITQETRNLSGADYWHARKADYPKQEPETWVNGKANIAAFKEEQPKPKKKSVADSIDLAERHYQRMEKMSEQLDEEYFAGELEEERYQLLRYKMDERLAKAWKRLEKDNSPIWNKLDESYQIESIYHQENYNINVQSKKTLTEGNHFINLVFNGLPDDNVFKAGFLFIQKMMRMFK